MKVERDTPMPDTKRGTKYPFGDMDVGDSVFILGRKRDRVGRIYYPGAHAAYKYGRYHGKSFFMRVEGDGCRIWRNA